VLGEASAAFEVETSAPASDRAARIAITLPNPRGVTAENIPFAIFKENGKSGGAWGWRLCQDPIGRSAMARFRDVPRTAFPKIPHHENQ
jgi:hypothetical protein